VGPLTHWRGQPDTVDRRLRWLVLVSLALHTPLTPLIGLLGLVSLLNVKKPEPVDADPLTAIPVDLLEGDELGSPAPAPPAPPLAMPESALEPDAPPKPKTKPKPKPLQDAGVPDAEPPDAEPPDAEAPDAALDAGLADAATTPADAGDAAATDAGIASADGGSPNPMGGLVGDVKKVIDQDANVRLVIYPEKIRNHPLAPRIGQLLASIYQWRDFFGPSKLDPIRDVDRIMVVGPEMRDSSKIAAIIQHNVGATRMHDALDAIVRADPDHGAWLDAGSPAATAYADRAPRILVMPSPNVVVVVPPNLRDAALSLKRVRVPKATGSEVMWAYAVTPWHAARSAGIALPHSLAWAKIWVTPTAGGGAVVEAEAEDESPESAAKHAEELNAQIQDALSMAASFSLLGQVLLGTHATRLVESVELHADGNKIRGTATLTEEQIERLFEQVRGLLVERRVAPAHRDAAAP
jgi:hypothetical protein